MRRSAASEGVALSTMTRTSLEPGAARLAAGDEPDPDHLDLSCSLAQALSEATLAVTNRGGAILMSGSIREADVVETLLRAHGREVVRVDPTDLDAVGAAVGSTTQGLVVDSLTELAQLVNVNALAEMCHSHDLVLVVDNDRLGSSVLDPMLVGANLALERTPRHCRVSGDPWLLACLRRALDGVGDLPEVQQENHEPPAAPTTDPAALARALAAAGGRPLSFDGADWAFETHLGLGDLRLASAQRWRGSVPAAGLRSVRDRLYLVDLRFVDDAGLRLLTQPADESADPVIDRLLSQRRAAQPWSGQSVSEVDAQVGPKGIVCTVAPASFMGLRAVRPFRLTADGDASTLRRAAVEWAQAALSAPYLGAPLRATRSRPITLHAVLADQGGRTLATHQVTASPRPAGPPDRPTRTLVIDAPRQAGGRDEGPDAVEVLLAAVLADLGGHLCAAVGAPSLPLHAQARRPADPVAPLTDITVYAVIDPREVAPASDALATWCPSAPVSAVLSTDTGQHSGPASADA